ncbi:MAG: hypothetical protein ABEJ76_00370 [Halanaeroarchaeum sp.]
MSGETLETLDGPKVLLRQGPITAPMPHSPAEARDVIERACRFPADHEEVVESLEDESIRSPKGEPVPVESVLAVSDERRYESADDLHGTLLANLTEEHVGRKGYDDRAPNPGRDRDVSF